MQDNFPKVPNIIDGMMFTATLNGGAHLHVLLGNTSTQKASEDLVRELTEFVIMQNIAISPPKASQLKEGLEEKARKMEEEYDKLSDYSRVLSVQYADVQQAIKDLEEENDPSDG